MDHDVMCSGLWIPSKEGRESGYVNSMAFEVELSWAERCGQREHYVCAIK